ncbi:hypothetical protein G9A89_017927 [Geosiphon pyriformis]|nr:hypothetical protein G9A89_017927 [Geosiphon pyriformis]
MDLLARRAVNLSVLRRHDKNIVEIIDSSSYVVVYKFDNQTRSWTKKGVEGTLFVFKRCVQPVYGFIVMNRLGIDNFVASLTDGMNIEFTDTYIMYKTDEGIKENTLFAAISRIERPRPNREDNVKLSKTAIPPPPLSESPRITSTTSIATPPPSQSYGKSIDIVTLFQQAGTNQMNGASNGSLSPRQPTPPLSSVSERDILNNLFLKANVNESRRSTPQTVPMQADGNQLDGKSLLDLLRQSSHTPKEKSVTPIPHSTTSSNSFHIPTPPPQRPGSLPAEHITYNNNNNNNNVMKISGTSFFQKLLQGSHASHSSHTVTLPPNLPVQISKTSQTSVSTGEAPNLLRKEALKVSIASLTKLPVGQGMLFDGMSTLSKSEFAQRYLQMIQNSIEFLTTTAIIDNNNININHLDAKSTSMRNAKVGEQATTSKKKRFYPFWLGGAAAMCAALITHPFDLVKVRLQTSKGATKASSLQTALTIIQTEGIRGLYQGLSASLLRQATYSTMRFGTYDKVKQSLIKKGDKDQLSFGKMIAAAAVGGAVGGACGNPADIVMVRMQNDAKLESKYRRNYRNALDGIIRIGREEGLWGFFRGVGPNMNRAVLMNISQVATYDQFKLILLRTGYLKDNILSHFTASLLSGLVATTICSPVDVIKTRVMNVASKSQGTLPILMTIIRQEGPLALFKGWVPAYLRLGPHTIITFVVLEKMKEVYSKQELFGIRLF